MSEKIIKQKPYHASNSETSILHHIPIDNAIELSDPPIVKSESQNEKNDGNIQICDDLPPSFKQSMDLEKECELKHKNPLRSIQSCGELPPPYPTQFMELESMECETDSHSESQQKNSLESIHPDEKIPPPSLPQFTELENMERNVEGEELPPATADFSEIDFIDPGSNHGFPQTDGFSELREEQVDENITAPTPDNFAEVETPFSNVQPPLTTEFQELDLAAWIGPESDQIRPGAYFVPGLDEEEKSSTSSDAQQRNNRVAIPIPVAYPCGEWPRAIPLYSAPNDNEEERPKLSPLSKVVICVILCSLIISISILKTLSVRKSRMWQLEIVGSLIRGTGAFDRIGSSISMCSNGQRIAIGSTGYNRATTLIYDFVDGEWVLNIDFTDRIPTNKYTNFKRTEVSLSYDCKQIAIGLPHFDAKPVGVTYGVDGNVDRGNVLIYHLIDNNWKELGKINLDKYGFMSQTGHTVAFSGDGKRVCFGGTSLSVFELKRDSKLRPEWERIFYERSKDETSFYYVLEIDYYGTKVVMGQPRSPTGKVQIYDILSSQLVASFSGTSKYKFGETISLSSNGNRLAIGAKSEKNVKKNSFVRVFEYSELNNQWSQLGHDIKGANIGVSLSDEGCHLAIVSPSSDANRNINVQIYELKKNAWRKSGNVVVESNVEESELSISMSANGTFVAVGTTGVQSQEYESGGEVYIYRIVYNNQNE